MTGGNGPMVRAGGLTDSAEGSQSVSDINAWEHMLAQNAWTPTYSSCSGFTVRLLRQKQSQFVFHLSASGNAFSHPQNNYKWNGAIELITATGSTYLYDGDSLRTAKLGSKLYWFGCGADGCNVSGSAGTSAHQQRNTPQTHQKLKSTQSNLRAPLPPTHFECHVSVLFLSTIS
jgi:hypothetical protein